MSEYQYYEFQALDRPLTKDEMRQLRAVSTRASITPTRFVNEYHWGGFKGDAYEWMKKYFDIFLYYANWGTRELMLRFPAGVLDLKTAKRYCMDDVMTASASGDFVILTFISEEEGGDDWIEEEHGWTSSILPVRAEIAGGDLRALYLAWLRGVQYWDLDEDDAREPEPPVPPGLATLTPALKAFADFLRIGEDLIDVAAERSPAAAADGPRREEMGAWIAALADAEKTELLSRVAAGEAGRVQAELLLRFRRATRAEPAQPDEPPRTAGELLAAAERRTEARARAEAERKARERAEAERKAAEKRARYLEELAGRQEETWRRVEALISTKQPKPYDEAAALLRDLRDLAARDGRGAEFEARMLELRERHARKPSLLERLDRMVGRAPGFV